jgi:hypothetical protein
MDELHEFRENVEDGSMCLCGIPAYYHEEWEYRTLRSALETKKVQHLLAEVYLPEGVKFYMQAMNRNLGMKSPNELIANGQGDEVLAEVERLVGGAW